MQKYEAIIKLLNRALEIAIIILLNALIIIFAGR